MIQTSNLLFLLNIKIIKYTHRCLHKASMVGVVEIVKLLLDFNADKSIKNFDNMTALDVAKLLQLDNWEKICQLLGPNK